MRRKFRRAASAPVLAGRRCDRIALDELVCDHVIDDDLGLAFAAADAAQQDVDRRIGHCGDRLAHRTHRYMPPSLLGSQFATLEEPGPDEHALVVMVHSTLADTVVELLTRLAERQREPQGDHLGGA